ncbi:hypothetical protein MHYP_G00232220 [Metynnis hypsauchen]
MASSGMDASAGFVARNDTSLLQSSYSFFVGPLPAAGAPHSPLAHSSWTPPLAKSDMAPFGSVATSYTILFLKHSYRAIEG